MYTLYMHHRKKWKAAPLTDTCNKIVYKYDIETLSMDNYHCIDSYHFSQINIILGWMVYVTVALICLKIGRV